MSQNSRPSSTSSSLPQSAKLSPPPSASIEPVLLTDLSQYDALLQQKHTYPLEIVAIYYITSVYYILNSFIYEILDILKCANKPIYIVHKLFKKEAIDKLLSLQGRIKRERFVYTTLNGSQDITNNYELIVLLLGEKIDDFHKLQDLYFNLRKFLKEVKGLDAYKQEIEMNKIKRRIWNIHTDVDLENYMRNYFYKERVPEKLQSIFKNISIISINSKLDSQYRLILELIDILNSIWLDEKAKEQFIKYILKKENTVTSFRSGQKGGVLGFYRAYNYLRSVSTQANRVGVVPEQPPQVNKYKRANIANIKNIYAFFTLLVPYIFEVDEKMYNKSNIIIKRYKDEYKHLYNAIPPSLKDGMLQFKGRTSPKPVMSLEDQRMKKLLETGIIPMVRNIIRKSLKSMELRLTRIENDLSRLI
jgi:hypothetical protein